MNNDIDIAELKRLHSAATGGEITVDAFTDLITDKGTRLYFSGIVTPLTHGPAQQEAKANAREYAALHNAFPALIAHLEAAEAKVEEQEAQIEALELDGEEYEKDCKKALVSLASAFNYEWDGDGATADELREFIQETVRLARDRAAAMQWRCPKCGIGPRDEKGDS